MKDILPDQVIAGISEHLIDGCAHGEEGWDAGEDEEDTLTGDLGGSLRQKWKVVHTQSGDWKWRLKYKKFRGRGKGAAEKLIGADGIFQIEVEKVKGIGETKGLLFQAKKINSKGKDKLLEQLGHMEDLVPNGSVLIEYGPSQYDCFGSSNVIAAKGKLKKIKDSNDSRLGSYLAKKFLLCEVGVRGLYYEAPRKTLIIPNSTNGYTRVKTKLTHRFTIEVKQLSSSSTN